ncbi:ABC-three component system middle component 6 [Flavobacterium sp.]|uniref:ABC-three component system middle component 6 n=1 Tax=Flavobacterium sp. TaxID=239 RepID=UPI00342E3322
MILPTKTIQPVDSLLSISALIIEILKEKEMTLDDLFDEFNKRYYKKITIEKLILSVDFLYITNKVTDNNAIIKINI